MLAPWKKSFYKHRRHIKNQRRDFASKVLHSHSYGFPSSHVWMWQLNHKESWTLKNWWFWTMLLEKTLEGPLDSKEIKLVNLKGNQSWIFIRRTDVEAEVPIIWPSDVKNWLIRKNLDAAKDWRQEKRVAEDEMVESCHWLDGHEFEHTLAVGDRQGSCCVVVHAVARSWTQLNN